VLIRGEPQAPAAQVGDEESMLVVDLGCLYDATERAALAPDQGVPPFARHPLLWLRHKGNLPKGVVAILT